jgi:hypothetical protein
MCAYLSHQLEACEGNVSMLAKLIGKNRTDVYKLTSRYHVDILRIREALAPGAAAEARRARAIRAAETREIFRRWNRAILMVGRSNARRP